MKDLSLFLLKNSLASKMKRGFRSFCHGAGSTSTLNQQKPYANFSYADETSDVTGSPVTLEEMILKLDIEEEAVRRAKLDEYNNIHRRMSCVNNSDILRSARNALNQYPRFSLDGKDAMYRSSFRNLGKEVDLERTLTLPPTLAGEKVVWCKPGVVAKLMGLEAVPVPASGRRGGARKAGRGLVSRKERLRRMGRRELERERINMAMHGWRNSNSNSNNSNSNGNGNNFTTKVVGRDKKGLGLGSCSVGENCGLSPGAVEPGRGEVDWRFRRAR